MNIVYLIGNGFDIGLGLKTSYRDFIDAYMKKKCDNENVAWMKEQMAGNPQQWSDAEIAFGKLNFSERGKSPVKVYNDCYDDFADAFIDHLMGENDRFAIPIEKRAEVSEEFLKCALNLGKHMTEGCATAYNEKLKSQSELNLYFLTFNYTDSLEKILDVEKFGSQDRKLNVFGDDSQKVVVKAVCHVHGQLDGDYVFGIDSPSQITDEKVRSHCERNGGMIKATSEEKLGLTNRKRGISILNKADIIIPFGLSFGESDHSWWVKLHSRSFSTGVQMILCPFTTRIPQHLGTKQQTDINRSEKLKAFHSLFLKNPSISESVEAVSANQITVLKLKRVPDGRGKVYPCDYFHLTPLSRFVRKVN
ncbi:MAG: bacteriophage abortive infection AbiH family protein [Kiritimatiellae bacterium]|nr:bacteriophage abortive infection AbiH family protein [Kiritimatiellia bacterium]